MRLLPIAYDSRIGLYAFGRVGRDGRRTCHGALVMLLIGAVFTAGISGAQSVHLQTRDAVVWDQRQVVRGLADGVVSTGVLYVNHDAVVFEVESGGFAVDVYISDATNVLVACTSDGTTCSDTLYLDLGYVPAPEPYAYAEVDDRSVTLRVEMLERPSGAVISRSWTADAVNPSTVSLTAASDSIASVTIPTGSPPGEYYFDVVVEDEGGREGRARTFVTVDGDDVTPFDIYRDHAAWVDRAVVYEVTPYTFHGNGQWRDVTGRLAEIAELGVNTLWIQPVFATAGRGQGYDITDYFRLRSDLGTPEDLRDLVRRAKDDYGMRVLFDFVPNHTSIEHPYARDVLEHGEDSHYYDFYLTEADDAPYSQHYKTGKGPFFYYFWDDLVIIDYTHDEVYRWMMEAGRHWVETYDIDGYRIDAVWGVNARTPQAMQKWRFDLKRLKPELFLLGEDKATWPSSFDRRFDAAYDWYPGESWVSRWAWQAPPYSENEHRTIFNSAPEGTRSERLRDALTNQGDGWHEDAVVFRFMENNDTYPFLQWHGLERTKMAANLLFSLPGIPMLYNGQEIGRSSHPYHRWQTFVPGVSIRQQDPHGLHEHYRHLALLRSSFPALHAGDFEEVPVTGRLSDRVFSFRRWSNDDHVVSIVNMGESPERVRLQLPVEEMSIDADGTYYLTDLMTGDYWTLTATQLRFPLVDTPGYTTRLLAVSGQAVAIPTGVGERIPAASGSFAIDPNYPNPFTQTTTLTFETPASGRVTLRVFDLLGREVARVLEEVLPPGRHRVEVDGSSLPSGTYFYRLDDPTGTATGSMSIVK